MNSLYLYFFKQYKNTWKNLSLRIRIEIIILFVIYFSFFTTRLINIFVNQVSNSNSTPFGLSQIILHGFIFLLSLSLPFIHIHLVPKQKGLIYFRTLPLNRINTFWLLFFLHFKYQVIGFVILLPLIIAFIATAGVLHAVFFFICSLLYLTILILFTSDLSNDSAQKWVTFTKYFVTIFFVFSVYFLVYFFSDYYFLFDPVFLLGAIVLLSLRWNKIWMKWDNYMGKSVFDSSQLKIKNRWISYDNFNIMPFRKTTSLFAKEILNYLRNRKFIRLQIIYLIIYLLIMFVLHLKVPDNFVLISSFLSMFFIWLHFSLQFNEKYVKADSAVFMKTLPFRYHQLWMAKFFNEFLFVIILIFFLMTVFFIKGFMILEIFQSLLVILIFSLIVLATIINFKIIFFNRPRFAGYAYHFFIVFVSVMSYKYYLVGPIIALILLTYFTYYSYREFAR